MTFPRRPIHAFILAGALALAAPALAQEAEPTRDTPVARAPGVTLGALLPADLPEAAFLNIDVAANDADGPFEVIFEALMPDATILSILVSARERSVRMVAPLFEPGPMRDALVDDEDFTTPEGAICLGSTEQAMITCSIGEGVLQVTGSSIGDEAFPYDVLKGHFVAIDLDVVAQVLAP